MEQSLLAHIIKEPEMLFNAVTAAIATMFVALGGWMSPNQQDKTFTTYGYVDRIEAPDRVKVNQPVVIQVSGSLPQAGLTFHGLELVENPKAKTILIKAVATGEKDKAYADMLSPYTATASYTPKVVGIYQFTVLNPNGETEPFDARLEVRP